MSEEKNQLVEYEKQIEELEGIVRKMESREISLDEAMKSYERGIHLVRKCQKSLTAAEQKIQLLEQDSNGDAELVDFSEIDD